jgi:hypothetical protein
LRVLEKPPIFASKLISQGIYQMKRTAEELIALREKREGDDKEKLREERKRAAGRAKRRRLNDGDLVKELGLTTEEIRGLVLDAQREGTRERWARLGRTGSQSRARAQSEAGAPPETEVVAEAAE